MITPDASTLARDLARLIDRYYHRADTDDQRTVIENLSGLHRRLAAYSAALATEHDHLTRDNERLRDERDEQLVRVQELTAELQELREAAGPTEVVLADRGTAVLS